jgi:hypothetical protein
MAMMAFDLLLIAAAAISVVVIFAGLLIVGDFQNNPCGQEIDRLLPRSF